MAAPLPGFTQALAAMKITIASLISLVLSGLSPPALGCSMFIPEPQEKFAMNSTVVLAYPIAIATKPDGALAPDFEGSFTQTIQWQVLVSWKGRYKPGDVITTMVEYTTSMCGSGGQYRREVMLLFLDGKEPFQSALPQRPVMSIEDLKFLEGLKVGG